MKFDDPQVPRRFTCLKHRHLAMNQTGTVSSCDFPTFPTFFTKISPLCVAPSQDSSHHQDDITFSVGDPYQLSFPTGILGGGHSTVLFCEIASNMTCFHYVIGLAKQHGGCKQDINHFRLIHQPEKCHAIPSNIEVVIFRSWTLFLKVSWLLKGRDERS